MEKLAKTRKAGIKKYDLGQMTRGWFIGPFQPAVMDTEQFECAVKHYTAGDKEAAHCHKVATEYTVIVKGRALLNGETYQENDIIEIAPGQTADFSALTDVVTVVVKTPAALGDKYDC